MTDLLTSAQVTQAIGLDTTLDARATALVGRIAAAIGPVIEDLAGPVLPVDKSFTTNGGRASVLLPHRPAAITAVKENDTATTDYWVDLDAAIVYAGTRLWPRSFQRGEVQVTYTVGVATVGEDGTVSGIPGHILYAAYEQCRIWWQQGQNALHSGFGYDGEGPSPVPMGFAVSTRVRELLAPSKPLPGFA